MNAPTPERSGSGWLARCSCGWERYDERRPAIDSAISKHTCRKVREPKQTKTAGPSKQAWNDREESTWIDQL